jgi:hypothetical protein
MLAYHHNYFMSLGLFHGEKQLVTNSEKSTLLKRLANSSKEAIYSQAVTYLLLQLVAHFSTN